MLLAPAETVTVGPNILYPTATITRSGMCSNRTNGRTMQCSLVLKAPPWPGICGCGQGRLSNATLVTDVVTGTEPRKLSSCRRHEVRFGAFYLPRSTSWGVSTAITCRRAPGCWVVVGDWRRGAAGSVSGRLSRVGFGGKGRSWSPYRGLWLPVGCWQTRRVSPRPTVVVWG